MSQLLSDLVTGIGYGLFYSRKHLVFSYGLVPIGIILIFMVLYGLNQLIVQIFKIKFPASVLGMLINLVFLCLLSYLSTFNKVFQTVLTHYLRVVQPSMNFSLKWINVFFIPSFIILPLSKPITIIEVLKIAAVFVFGWVALMGIDIYLILGLKWAFQVGKQKADIELEDMSGGETDSMEDAQAFSSVQSETYSPYSTTRDVEVRNVHSEPGNVLTKPDSAYLKNGAQSSPPTLFSPISTIETSSEIQDQVSVPAEEYPHLNERTQTIVLFITNYIDWILYGLLLVASIPLYFVKSYHLFLPFHLSITILAYYGALLIPLKWPVSKKFAHPILVSTFVILLVCFLCSLIYWSGKPVGFLRDLRYYKTGKNYLNLFTGTAYYDNGQVNDSQPITRYPEWPGCGDFLSSLMDISIVSLSLPMFTHRKDFVNNFWFLMTPILVSIGLTYFLYPIICYHIGISSARSIGFIGRSVTLALGTPLINSLEGSVSLMAVCTILSGILGVLIGDTVFNLLRISSSDFVTRGVSLGINCGAIATAHLLTTDPRAASMSSLSFSVFGTVMIIFSSIGAIRQVIQEIVHLN